MAFWNKSDKVDEEQRVIRNAQREENREVVEDNAATSFKSATNQEIDGFLEKLKAMAKSKRMLYDVYDNMAKDSLIAGAMSIICDDMVKKDFIRNKRVWAEVSDEGGDSEVVDKVNWFLNQFGMDNKMWGYGYRLLKYGECYLNTYDREFKDNTIDPDFSDQNGMLYDMVDNAADTLTLEKYGVKVGYGETLRDENGNVTGGYNLTSTDQYIHMVADWKVMRQKVVLKYHDANGEEKKDTFMSVIGSSYLEDAREAWSILDLIETLMLYVRYNKSDCYNTVQVEVGTASRTESFKILRDIKRIFNNQDAMNMKESTYTGYKKPIPHGENIYIATRQGKGNISVTPVGGDFDIKNVTDLDYWRDKMIAALRVLKSYIGQDDGNLSGMNNQSLTRQDIRYCRTVEAYKEVLMSGVKMITDYYLKTTGEEDSIDKYKICGAKIMSAETTDRMEDIQGRIELADALKEFIAKIKDADMDTANRIIVQKILDLNNIDPEFDKIWKDKNSDGSSDDSEGEPGEETPGEDFDTSSAELTQPMNNTPSEPETPTETEQPEEPEKNNNNGTESGENVEVV